MMDKSSRDSEIPPTGKLNDSAGPFSFTYLLYICGYFSSVGASCARDIASKP